MFYSTVSNLVSSDEDEDIYCPSLPSGGSAISCPSNETKTTAERQTDLDVRERDQLRPYQVNLLVQIWV